VGKSIDTKCLKRGQDDENCGPTMVQREWQMDEKLVGKFSRLMELFDGVIYVLGKEQSK